MSSHFIAVQNQLCLEGTAKLIWIDLCAFRLWKENPQTCVCNISRCHFLLGLKFLTTKKLEGAVKRQLGAMVLMTAFRRQNHLGRFHAASTCFWPPFCHYNVQETLLPWMCLQWPKRETQCCPEHKFCYWLVCLSCAAAKQEAGPHTLRFCS